MVYFPFGEWKPDESSFGVDTLKKAYQVFSNGQGYAPLQGMVASSEPMEKTALGLASFVNRNGVVITIAGDENSLYISRGSGWENISKVGGYNAVGQVWRFVLWGDYILATNFNDPIQAWQIDSDENFQNMSETAPRCKDMAIVNEFLVLVNTVDELDSERPNRIWWSPIANPFGEWVPSAATLCDYQDIQIGSFCVGIVGGAYAIVMMRNAMIRMTFIGSPIAFMIETVEANRGTVGIEAFTTDGDNIYYVAQDGFFLWNGVKSISLSAGKIDRWFFDNVEQTSDSLIITAFDGVKKIVMFGYPQKGEYEKPNKLLVYSVLGARWSEAECKVIHFSQFLSQGYTLDDLDYMADSLEELPFALDSNYYKGGIPSISGLGSDGVLYTQNNQAVNGQIITGDITLSGNNNDIAMTQRVRLIIEGSSKHQMAIATEKLLLSENNKFGRLCKLTNLGDFSERKSGRYHCFCFELRGNWKATKGFDVTYTIGENLWL